MMTRITGWILMMSLGIVFAACIEYQSSESESEAPPFREAFGSNREGGAIPMERSDSGDYLILGTYPIVDEQGWGRPIEAASILIPVQWQVQGGIYWDTSTACPANFINRRMEASAPDGSVGFELLPSLRWQWAREQILQAEIQMRQCPVAPPIDAEGALQRHILPAFRPGARVLDVTPFPQAAEGVRQEYYRVWGPLFQMQNSQVGAQAIRARIEYERNGRLFEEWILLATTEIATPSFGGTYYSYAIDYVYAFRAPRGRLDEYENLFSAMVSSYHQNPAWETAVVRLMADINRGISIQAGQRARIWQNAMNEIGRIRAETWQQQQDTLSRVSVSWSRAMRGVDGYVDPTTQQTVELPTGYRNAWSDGQGTYLVTVDPSFDPNTELERGSWQRMRQSGQ